MADDEIKSVRLISTVRRLCKSRDTTVQAKWLNSINRIKELKLSVVILGCRVIGPPLDPDRPNSTQRVLSDF
jgi:hypothetical protein